MRPIDIDAGFLDPIRKSMVCPSELLTDRQRYKAGGVDDDDAGEGSLIGYKEARVCFLVFIL